MRYVAFISYRREGPDDYWAKWLREALLRYRTPRRLRRRHGLPARVGDVFRDVENFDAEADLSEATRTRLAESKYLIVVCSPRAKGRPHVEREIQWFRSLGREAQIRALLIEGDPQDSFPLALRGLPKPEIKAIAEQDPLLGGIEPLAADVRPTLVHSPRRAREKARLMLVAALLGCRFEMLREEERRRTIARVAIATLACCLVAAVIGLLGKAAFESSKRENLASIESATRKILERGRYVGELARSGDSLLALAEGAAAVDSILTNRSLPRQLPSTLENGLSLALHATREISKYHDSARVLKDACFSPNGRRVMTSCVDGFIRIFDTATGALEQKIEVTVATFHVDQTAARFSPDGNSILLRGYDNHARLYDLLSGQFVGDFTGQNTNLTLRFSNSSVIPQIKAHPVFAAEFSPDGSEVLLGSEDGSISLYRIDTGALLYRIQVPKSPVRDAQFSSDSHHILVVSGDGLIRLLDASDLHLIAELDSDPKGIREAMFAPDGTSVLTIGETGTARLWKMLDLKNPIVLSGSQVDLGAFSSDGKLMALAGRDNRTLRIHETDHGTLISQILNYENIIDRLSFVPGANRLLIAGLDGLAKECRIWLRDPYAGNELESIRLRTESVGISSLRYSKDGTRIVTTFSDSTARCYQTDSGRPSSILTLAFPAFRPSLPRWDKDAVIIRSQDGSIRRFDGVSGKTGIPQPTLLRSPGTQTTSMATSRDGTLLAICRADAKIEIVSALSPTAPHDLGTFSGSRPSVQNLIEFDDAASRLLTGGQDGVAHVWDVATGEETYRTPQRTPAVKEGSVAIMLASWISGSDDFVAVANDGYVACYHLGESEPRRQWHSHDSFAFSASIARDSGFMAIQGMDKGHLLVRVFDFANGKRIFEVPSGSFTETTFSPEGSTLALYGPSTAVRLFAVPSGEFLVSLSGRTKGTEELRFDPSGRRLLTRGSDGAILVSSAKTGEPIQTIPGNGTPLACAEFSPTFERVLTVAADGKMRIYNTAPETLVRATCERLQILGAGSEVGQGVDSLSQRLIQRMQEIPFLSREDDPATTTAPHDKRK